MSIYKPKGRDTYVMDFVFKGQRVYETTGEKDKRRAQREHDKRLTELKDGAAGLRKKKQQFYLGEAVKEWRSKPRKKPWSKATEGIVDGALRYLIEHEVVDAEGNPVKDEATGKAKKRGHFKPERLLADLDAADIAEYQKMRLAAGLSNRTVNIEVGVLRKVLIATGHWQRLKDEVHMLSERADVGKALSTEQERLLLEECAASVSATLLPFVTLAIDTGARYNTIRTLQWGRVDLEQGRIVIGKDKTAAGTGRIVPLNVRALAALTAWAEQFPKREPEHYVFPTEKYGLHGEEGKFGGVVRSYKADVTKPIGTIKSAWESAKKRTRYHCPECKAGRLVSAKKPAMGYACEECGVLMDELPIGAEGFRFHDLRHTAVSRMIVGGAPLPVIAKVVGWKLSTVVDMAERYGHFEEDAMRRAVQAIGAAAPAPSTAKVLPMPQRPARLLHAAD